MRTSVILHPEKEGVWPLYDLVKEITRELSRKDDEAYPKVQVKGLTSMSKAR